MATMRKNLGRLLASNSYPGRGIVAGKSQDGKKAFVAYFIMGRSQNSRNRVFAEYGDEVRTQPFDASKVSDPSLIIYSPIKRVGSELIVTNGDQTDSIEQFIREGVCFRRALMQRSFEPDAPVFTPRISAVLHFGERVSDFSYEFSILKCADGKGRKCDRQFFLYEPVSGSGHFLHTYERDGNPPLSFRGEPVRVKLGSDLKAFAEEIWGNLDEANKISLYCRSVDLRTGETENVLYNKYSNTGVQK